LRSLHIAVLNAIQYVRAFAPSASNEEPQSSFKSRSRKIIILGIFYAGPRR